MGLTRFHCRSFISPRRIFVCGGSSMGVISTVALYPFCQKVLKHALVLSKSKIRVVIFGRSYSVSLSKDYNPRRTVP